MGKLDIFFILYMLFLYYKKYSFCFGGNILLCKGELGIYFDLVCFDVNFWKNGDMRFVSCICV